MIVAILGIIAVYFLGKWVLEGFKPFFQMLYDGTHNTNEGVNTSEHMPVEHTVKVIEPVKPIVTETTISHKKKFIYRPETFDDLIGQESVKGVFKLNMKKIQKGIPVHILLDGKAGHGKTSTIYVLRNELNAEMIECIGSSIESPDDIIELINKINSSKSEMPMVFIDEIHNLNFQLCELFYPMMEDFRYNGQNIKPFILVGATTEKNILVEKVAPFVDRFQLQVTLENYNASEIKQILTNYKIQMYPDIPISDSLLEAISKNCKFTPRIALALLSDATVESDINTILKYRNIIKDGLNKVDYRILEFLNKQISPVGEENLSSSVGIKKNDYHIVYEPFLLEYGYIQRQSRGRVITEKGKEIVLEVSNDK